MILIRFIKILCNWLIGLGFIFVAWFGISNNETLTIQLFPFSHTWDINLGIIIFVAYLLGICIMLIRMGTGRVLLWAKSRASKKITKTKDKNHKHAENSSSVTTVDSTTVQPPRPDY